MLGLAGRGGAPRVGAQRLLRGDRLAGVERVLAAVRRLTMSWMPSSGAPLTTGRSELPGSTTPASRTERCRYSQAWRAGPTAASMPSPISVANRPWPTGITPRAAARATWSGRAAAKSRPGAAGRGAGSGPPRRRTRPRRGRWRGREIRGRNAFGHPLALDEPDLLAERRVPGVAFQLPADVLAQGQLHHVDAPHPDASGNQQLEPLLPGRDRVGPGGTRPPRGEPRLLARDLVRLRTSSRNTSRVEEANSSPRLAVVTGRAASRREPRSPSHRPAW